MAGAEITWEIVGGSRNYRTGETKAELVSLHPLASDLASRLCTSRQTIAFVPVLADINDVDLQNLQDRVNAYKSLVAELELEIALLKRGAKRGR